MNEKNIQEAYNILIKIFKNHFETDLPQLIKHYLEQYDNNVPKNIKDIIDNLLLELKEIELDIDLKNKREVYLEVANFLKKEINQELPRCLTATHIICQEKDSRLLAYDVSNVQDIVNHVKALILKISVHYKTIDSLKYLRTIEIFFIKNGKPVLKKLEQNLDWDELPPDVRESWIRGSEDTQTFNLYQG